ncbi:MAG: flavin reductase family protein [Eubacteriales bacterium]|nr:flavin reductase family protein [Eubacteriales bacterium]
MPFLDLKPGTMLSPTPVVMASTADLNGNNNIITIAWTGVVNSKPPMVYISVKPSRHSHKAILDTGEFVINLVTQKLTEAADFCGVKSGRDLDKFELCNLHPYKTQTLKYAPAIKEAPIWLACKVNKQIALPSHTMFIADITEIKVKKHLLDEFGRVDYKKAQLIAYQHGEYYALADCLGFFGFSIASPDVLKRRMKK